jgi:hypothetical protein
MACPLTPLLGTKPVMLWINIQPRFSPDLEDELTYLHETLGKF